MKNFLKKKPKKPENEEDNELVKEKPIEKPLVVKKSVFLKLMEGENVTPRNSKERSKSGSHENDQNSSSVSNSEVSLGF